MSSQLPLLDPMTLPLEQRVLIEASAGTGKTYTIAALYLRLILGLGTKRPYLPSEILVVTFTEAATSELKGRIRARLSQASQYFSEQLDDVDGLLQSMRQHYATSDWLTCAERLRQAAQAMDEACVMTIHGWCHRMLTEHAFASGSPFGQTLVPDLSKLREEIAQDYWRQFVYPMTPESFRRFSQFYPTPAALIADAMHLGMAEPTAKSSPSELITAELLERQRQVEILKAPFVDWLGQIDPLLQQAIANKWVDGRKLRADWVNKWLSILNEWVHGPSLQLPELGAGLQRLTPEGLQEAWKQGDVIKHPAFEAISALPTAFAAMPDVTADLRLHAACWQAQRFEQRKQRLHQLGFDDLLTHLRDALRREPQLAGLIAEQFPVALIDEFQDTDAVQYEIFSRVFSKDQGLILIGDPKQAIYGFRGADIFTYLQAAAESSYKVSLGTNYRSTCAMVGAVNRLFATAEQRPLGRGAFLFRDQSDALGFQVVQAAGRADQLFLQGQALPAMELLLDAPEKAYSKDEWLTQAANYCATDIVRLLQAGADGQAGFGVNASQLRPLLPQDIAVLVNNQTEANRIRKALFVRGVRSVYLSDKGSVFSSPIAAQLVLWLEAALQPRLAKVRNALGTAAFGFSFEQLANWSDTELDRYQQQFSGYGQQWLRHGVQAMLQRLMVDFDIARVLAQADDGERQLTDLLHLSSLLQHASRTLDGEQALLRYLYDHVQGQGDLSSDEVKLRLESDDALVRVVTIHKSKGLEYPCVFLPFLSLARESKADQLPYQYHDEQGQWRQSFQVDEAIWAKVEQERLAEDLRKLYVALTRASYYCQLLLTPHKSMSAVRYLLSHDAGVSEVSLAPSLEALSDGQQIVLRGPLLTNTRFLPASAQQALGQFATWQGQPRPRWWFSSYSALALAKQSDDPENKAAQLRQELLQPDVIDPPPQLDSVSHQLQKGAAMGTFLHGQLEWAANQGFAKVHAQPGLWWPQLVSAAEQAGVLVRMSRGQQLGWRRQLLQTDQTTTAWFSDSQQALEPLHQFLHELVQTLVPAWQCSLAQLPQSLAELEFWLPVATLGSRQLDLLIRRWIWPGMARPALQDNQLNGMLKGFIDLVFFDGRHYGVLDFKSNFLADYSEQALQQVMLEKRYDVQAVLYSLALRRLLKSRGQALTLAPAQYWFIRGYATPSAGVLSLAVPDGLLEQLERLFTSKGVSHVD